MSKRTRSKNSRNNEEAVDDQINDSFFAKCISKTDEYVAPVAKFFSPRSTIMNSASESTSRLKSASYLLASRKLFSTFSLGHSLGKLCNILSET